jgi:hypothetical protein
MKGPINTENLSWSSHYAHNNVNAVCYIYVYYVIAYFTFQVPFFIHQK